MRSYSPQSGYASTLPFARSVSAAFHGAKNGSDDARHSQVLMQFGQFIDHDVAATLKGGAMYPCVWLFVGQIIEGVN